MSSVIRFENVSKKFNLHRERARSFQELALSLFRRDTDSRDEEFWALRDVSFTVEQGETVGLIGPNGAGKSTALKLVSRIIEPTSGRIEANGRVGALLELGAGFHPDLSGRENVYLNGSILGLSRAQIRQKMDGIIAFAELERFIDMPVKHYSSGMRMRLGFSIAAHIEPEILLVDEVLAVGDAAFQRKCLERIDRMRSEGTTILFVSHSTEMVRKLCSRAVWLDEGELVADGSAESVATRYLTHTWDSEEGALKPKIQNDRRWGNGEVRITRVRLLDKDGQERQQFRVGEPLTVEMRYHTEDRVERPVFGLAVHRNDGVHITGPNTQFAGLDFPFIKEDGNVMYCVDHLSLLEGSYLLSVSVVNQDSTLMYDYHDRLYPFRVRQVGDKGERYGLVSLGGEWEWKSERMG